MNIPFPRISYNQSRKLIQAYYEIGKESVSRKEINDFILNDIQLVDISGSSKFLAAINILETTNTYAVYRPTEICQELGEAIRNSDEDKEADLLEKIINSNDTLRNIRKRIEYIVKIKGYIFLRDFKYEVIKLSGWEEKSKRNIQIYSVYAPTIINIFRTAKIIYTLKRGQIAIRHKPNQIELISSDYINQLEKLNPTKEFDLTRLINYCEQINSNYRKGYFESVAFLSRAIMDHVPPIFNQKNFQSMAQQVSSGKDSSFKKSCASLQDSLRHIVDELIHRPITSSHTPLAEQEINFSADINRLLRAVIDQLKSGKMHSN